MISLLVISGSPVPGASTDILLRQAADAVRRGLRGAARVRTTFVKLNDLRILPCQACGEAPTPQFCFFDDDMAPLYRELAHFAHIGGLLVGIIIVLIWRRNKQHFY